MLRPTAVLLFTLACSAVGAEGLSDKRLQKIAGIEYRGIGFSSTQKDLLKTLPKAKLNDRHAGSNRGIATYEYRDDPAIDCVLLRFFDDELVEIQYVYFPITIARMGGAKPITALAVAEYGEPTKQVGQKRLWAFPSIDRAIVVSESKGQWSQQVFHSSRHNSLPDYPKTTATPKENRMLVATGRVVPDMSESSRVGSNTIFGKQSVAYREPTKMTRSPTRIKGRGYLSNEESSISLSVFFLMALAILAYLFPAIIACNRGHRNSASITIVNVFFGWTLLGWGVALAWSLSSNRVNYSVNKRNCLRCGSRVGEGMIRCPYCIHEVGPIDSHLSPSGYEIP